MIDSIKLILNSGVLAWVECFGLISLIFLIRFRLGRHVTHSAWVVGGCLSVISFLKVLPYRYLANMASSVFGLKEPRSFEVVAVVTNFIGMFLWVVIIVAVVFELLRIRISSST